MQGDLEIEVNVKELREKLGIKDGYSPIPGIDFPIPEDGKNGIDGLNGKNGSPDTAKEILAKLKGKLNVKHIDDLTELLNEAGNNFLNQAKGFIPRSLSALYDVMANPIDGQVLTYQASTNKWIATTLPAPSGGGGVTFETLVGSIDGVNVTFTVTHIPAYVVSDNQTYFENNGYTRSGLTITLDAAPFNFIRSAY